MSVHVPKYIRVRDAILAKIHQGNYQPGDKLPVREDLIVEYGVTRTTIDKALRELIQTGVLKASRRLGTFVSERLPTLRTALVSSMRPSRFDGLTESDDLANMMHTIVTDAKGIDVSYLASDEVSTNLSMLTPYDLIFWVQPSTSALHSLTSLQNKVIVTNRYPDDLNFISTNHRQAIHEVTTLFLTHCPTESQFFFLSRERNDFVSDERREGFIQACSEHQRFYRICEFSTQTFDGMVEELMRLPVDRDKPVAMVASSCFLTGTVLKYVRLRGFELYKDFFYSDFDNYNSLQATGHRITTVIQDYKAMGEEVVKTMRSFDGSPVRKFIPHRLDGVRF